MPSKEKKWNAAYQDADYASALPAQVLSENSYLLPQFSQQQGNALDLACGRAGNAQFLAKRNFSVDAVDISSVVLEGLQSYVEQQDLSITCILRDIEKEGLSEKQYDVIVVSYFLNRELFPQILNALKPNGLLYYQTWSQLSVDDSGPRNPDFRLKAGELLQLTTSLQTLYYQEDGKQGDISKGLRNEALLIAKKI